MKILFLDDESIRFKKIKDTFIDDELIYVRTAFDAIEKIQLFKPDIIFLDHDLDDSFDIRFHDNTGKTVAKYIANMLQCDKPKLVIVHSMNVPASTNMMKILEVSNTECIVCPFALIDWQRTKDYASSFFIKKDKI